MTFQVDPADELDFVFDLKPEAHGVQGATSDWLAAGETVAAFTVTATTGLTVANGSATAPSGTVHPAPAQSDGKITYWVYGGVADSDVIVTCRVTTSSARRLERSALFRVRDL